MAVESSTRINLGKVGEFRIASASKGTALTDTASFTQFPLKTNRLTITPTVFTTAVVVRLLLNPWLTVLKTTDDMSTPPTDYSLEAQDNDTGTDVDLSVLNTRANGDFLLVGSHAPFRGIYFDVDGTNAAGTAQVTVYYWNGGHWVDTSATTTGIRTTAAWDKDGIVTWTVPTAWRPATALHLYPSSKIERLYYANVPLYWTRWEVDAAITDTAVTLNSMSAANRSSSYAELVSGQMVSVDIEHGFGGTACIEALTDAGTAYLVVNSISKGNFE